MRKEVCGNYVPRGGIADIGGRKVLNMGGSLTDWINTGNAYGRNYNNNCRDVFVPKKHKKKSILKKLLGYGTIGIVAFELARRGKIDKFQEFVSNLIKKIKK